MNAKELLRDIFRNAEQIARESKDILTDKNYAKFLAEEEEAVLYRLRENIEEVSSVLAELYCRLDEKSEENRTPSESAG